MRNKRASGSKDKESVPLKEKSDGFVGTSVACLQFNGRERETRVTSSPT